MLVRLDVLRALGGFDAALPVFGNDLDFGWRAASAGYRTIIVPQAVVFHAEAAHRGIRRTPLTGRHTHYQERRGGAVHAAGQQPGPVAAVPRGAAGPRHRRPRHRLPAGALGRRGPRRARGAALGLLPTAAALRGPEGPPGAHHRRSRHRPRPARPVVGALPARARLRQRPRRRRHQPGPGRGRAPTGRGARAGGGGGGGRAVALGGRAPAPSGTPSRPTTRTSSSPTRGCSPASSPVRSPSASRPSWSRSWSAPARPGGPCPAAPWRRLPPRPATGGSSTSSTGTRWRSARTRPHRPSCSRSPPWPRSSAAARPPRSAPCSCSPSPLALWGAWRLVRVVGRFLTPAGMPRWLVAGAAATYGLVPAVSGAWGGGRLGLVAAATLLPWLAHAALGFGEPERERRWRAAWRTGLLLALTTACAPAVFPFFVLLTLLVLGLGVAFSRSLVADRSVSGPPLVALAVVPLLLLPWWLPLLLAGRPGGLLLDPGRLPVAVAGFGDLLLGRVDDVGAPAWLTWPVIAAAALALLPRTSRVAALACWSTALVAAVTAALLSLPTVVVVGGAVRVGAAGLVPVIQGALVVAAAAGALALLQALGAAESPWRRRLAVVPAVIALGGARGGSPLVRGGRARRPERRRGLGHPGVHEPELAARARARRAGGPRRRRDRAGLRRSGAGTVTPSARTRSWRSPPRTTRSPTRCARSSPVPRPRWSPPCPPAGIEYVVLPAPADGRARRPARRRRRAEPGERRGPGHPRVADRRGAGGRGARRSRLVAAHRAAGRAGARDPGRRRPVRPELAGATTMSDVAPGRRSATPTTPRRRVTPAIVLAVLVPLLTLGALALVRTEQPRVAARPPELTELTRVSLGCPSAAGTDSRELAVGSALATEDGEVAVDVLGPGGAPQPRRPAARPGVQRPGPRGGRGHRRGRRGAGPARRPPGGRRGHGVRPTAAARRGSPAWARVRRTRR